MKETLRNTNRLRIPNEATVVLLPDFGVGAGVEVGAGTTAEDGATAGDGTTAGVGRGAKVEVGFTPGPV